MNSIIRDIDFVDSKSIGYCGPAVLQNMFLLKNRIVTQESIMELIGIPETKRYKGITIDRLSTAVQQLEIGFTLICKYFSNIEEIIYLILEKRECIGIEWQCDFFKKNKLINTEGHYSLIYGIDEKKLHFIFFDPEPTSVFRNCEIDIQEFQKRWWDVNEIDINKSSEIVKRKIINERLIFLLIPTDQINEYRILGFEKASKQLMIKNNVPKL